MRPSIIVNLVRGDNWWHSKIPPILAMAYLQMLIHPLAPRRAYVTLAALLFSATCLAAYAHVINDIFDIEADGRAGKRNGMARFAVWQRWLIFVGLGLAGFLPWLLIPLKVAAVPLVLIYLLPVLYATPPVRFKERGFAGALNDAGMVHAMPALFVFGLFVDVEKTLEPNRLIIMFAAGLWALCVGLRGILLGQTWDWENDVRTGTTTFTTRVGVPRVRALITRFIYPAEMIALITLTLVVYLKVPALFWVVAFALTLDWVRIRFLWPTVFDPAPPHGLYVVPHDLYQFWLPVALAALLALHHPAFLPLLVFQIVFFHQNFLAAQIREMLWELCHRSMVFWRQHFGDWRPRP